MTERLDEQQIDRLIADYLNGNLGDTGRPAFEDWLRASPDHPRRVASLSLTDYALREVCHDTKADYLLDVLNQIDEAAEPMKVTIHDGSDWKDPSLSNKQWRGAFSYLYEHYVTTRVIAGIASAAALLLSVVLVVVLLNGPSDDQQIAEQVLPNFEPEAAAESVPVVAVLTAERDAVWDRRPGQDLYAGQQFTLLEGFAEIKTQRGAVAILEGPATIELLDNNNALCLHTGKLFGVCETESSKGFLVRTPQIDITDLGTRFGVDADGYSTELHVFEGAVSVSRSNASDEAAPTLVRAGESVATAIDTRDILKMDLAPAGFDALQAPPLKLRGTGQGLAAGQPDSNWQLMTASGSLLPQPVQMPVAPHNAYGQYRDQNGGSQGPWWLQVVPDQQPTPHQQEVVHLIEAGFELPAGLRPESTRLVIACAADDYFEAIHINGHRVTDLGTKIGRVHHLTIDQHLVVGHNTVEFEIKNKWNDPNSNPIGLYVRWHLLPEAAVDLFGR